MEETYSSLITRRTSKKAKTFLKRSVEGFRSAQRSSLIRRELNVKGRLDSSENVVIYLEKSLSNLYEEIIRIFPRLRKHLFRLCRDQIFHRYRV